MPTLTKLLVATTNAGKWREIRRILEGIPIELTWLGDLPAIPEPVEDGQTFAENALIKASYYASRAESPTVAEDSGLTIDVLGGRPGVESARYPGATYSDKFANLYRELASHAEPWRARFVCSLVVVDADNVLFTCERDVLGEIVPAPRGAHGFGYDPIFLYPPYSRTLGEVTDDEKIAVSHRGEAFRALREWLERVRG